jgi:toxin ParE1/3/4
LKIRWTEGASKNLDEIENYIGQDNTRAAVKTALQVINSINQLSRYPAIGRAGRIEGTRELIVPDTPFIVPYRVKNKTIEILRIFHHSRKWPKRL